MIVLDLTLLLIGKGGGWGQEGRDGDGGGEMGDGGGWENLSGRILISEFLTLNWSTTPVCLPPL